MTTVGYGDLHSMQVDEAENQIVEITFCMVMIFSGLLAFSFITTESTNIEVSINVEEKVKQNIEDFSLWLNRLDKIKKTS